LLLQGENSEIWFVKGYGEANVAEKAPVTADKTLFHIAAVLAVVGACLSHAAGDGWCGFYLASCLLESLGQCMNWGIIPHG
jgi:hypothetical protein